MVRNMVQKVFLPVAHKEWTEIKPWCLRVVPFLSRLQVQDVKYMPKTLNSMIFQSNSLEI